uniref:Uncharacterized protein n=1 Tax=Oryza brachyantha TaxID=4533 RepID=J3N9B6_ORYBR
MVRSAFQTALLHLKPEPKAICQARAAADAALGLGVGELVPEGAARGVPPPVQRHPRRLHVPAGEGEVLLDGVQHGAAAGVDAEVLERHLEVRDVGLDAGEAEHLARHQRRQEEDLLRHGEDEGPQRGDVRPQRLAGDGHEILGQGHPDRAGVVLLLEHASVRPVVGAVVGPHRVQQLVLAPPPVAAAVAEQDRRTAHPEQAVRHQHRPVVPPVPVQRDVLHAHHQRVRIPMHLQITQNLNF